MYNYITGKVVYSAGNTIVVDNNGIGYEIGASNFTTNKFSEGEIAKIYTYLYVREDTYALYGCNDRLFRHDRIRQQEKA